MCVHVFLLCVYVHVVYYSVFIYSVYYSRYMCCLICAYMYVYGMCDCTSCMSALCDVCMHMCVCVMYIWCVHVYGICMHTCGICVVMYVFASSTCMSEVCVCGMCRVCTYIV